jgi:hypothetical protein
MENQTVKAPDELQRALWLTIRRALIMIVKAIEFAYGKE